MRIQTYPKEPIRILTFQNPIENIVPAILYTRWHFSGHDPYCRSLQGTIYNGFELLLYMYCVTLSILVVMNWKLISNFKDHHYWFPHVVVSSTRIME